MGQHRVLRADVSCLQTSQSGATAAEKTITTTTCSKMPMEKCDHGLHHFPTKVQRIWNTHGCAK